MLPLHQLGRQPLEVSLIPCRRERGRRDAHHRHGARTLVDVSRARLAGASVLLHLLAGSTILRGVVAYASYSTFSSETTAAERRAKRRRQRRAALLRAKASQTLGRIFGKAWRPWAELILDQGDVEFMERLQKLQATTEQLIGADEEKEMVGALEAQAAVTNEQGVPWLEKKKGAFKSYIDTCLAPRRKILLHDACGRRSGDGWILPIEAWVYRENQGRHMIRLALVQKFLIEMKHGIKNVDLVKQQRYELRGRMIFRNLAFRGGEKGHRLRVRFGGKSGGDQWRDLPETDEEGRISTEVYLSSAEVEQLLGGAKIMPVEVHGGLLGTTRPEGACVHLVDETGVSIISDMDDTVKITEVFKGKDAIVGNTFFEEFCAVPGMPELYQRLASAVPGTSFHFVSNSPPELLEPLRDFLRCNDFPFAPLHLRPLFGPDRPDFKAKSIQGLLRKFPGRRFILVGDSGESDPRVYADIMRAHPSQVAHILIREVDTSCPVDEMVFDGLDPSRWHILKDPSEFSISALAI